jgi:hypothetical protein
MTRDIRKLVLFSLPELLHFLHCKDTTPEIRKIYSRKGIARGQSQFPHSCVGERFIYTQDRSAYSAAGKYVGGPILGIYKSRTDT